MNITHQRRPVEAWGTPGEWTDEDGNHLCYILERRPDDPVHPCVDAATYECQKSMSPTLHYVTPELLNVPGRTGIRFHIGCLMSDSEGCLLAGSAFGYVDYGDGRKGDGVINSTAAFRAVMAKLPDTFTLTIKDPQ